MAYGAQQTGYVQAGTRSIGNDSYGASQAGYNSGTQTIAATASGAMQLGINRTVYSNVAIQRIAENAPGAMQAGENYGGKQTISAYAAGASQSGVNSAIQTIGERAFGAIQHGWNDGSIQLIGMDSAGARQSGYNLGSQVIGNNVSGASQQGFVAALATATNNGVGAMQLLELFNGENALTTAGGASSLLLGAGIVSNKNAIVAGNGGHSHGDGSITATGGFHGNATSATVVTGNQSNTIANALQPGATNDLWKVTTNFVLKTSLESMQYPVFNIPLNGWTDFELKASTNNFNQAYPNHILLWYESLGKNSYPGWSTYVHADLHAQTFYCNPNIGSFDGRAWLLATNTLSLTEQIGLNANYQDTIVCIPSMTVYDGGTNYWMHPSNESLTWVYRRRTSAYGETNALGREIWHPIVPSQWRRTPLNIHF
jgi:hypothetical protein